MSLAARPRALFRRFAPSPTPRQSATIIKTMPAPVRGWVTNENLALANGLGCRVLENWFPEYDGVRPRGGAAQVATIGDDRVESMFTYSDGTNEFLFAASATDIYDVSALNPSTPPAAAVSSQTSGYYSAAQIATSGGEYLYVCNEADAPQLFDGSSWTQITGVSTPAITGVTTTLLRAVWSYRNRLFFIERASLRGWALPTESIGGSAIEIVLQGVFKKGGALLFGATWSFDSGAGIDDKCVFVTDQGEVAVYEGSDPSDATNWNLVGVYDISLPLGKNARVNLAGDLVIATVDGMVPMTQVIKRDPAELSVAAISAAIEPNWKEAAQARNASYPWPVIKYNERNMLVIGMPQTITTLVPECLVVNIQTRAWCKFSGWDVQCGAIFGGAAYFGASNGEIYQMDTTGQDGSSSYVCKLAYDWGHLDAPAAHKDVSLARALFLASQAFNVKIEMGTNYVNTFGAAPSAAADAGAGSVWDTALWDAGIWDDTAGLGDKVLATTRWRAVAGAGFVHAPQLQITIGNTAAPDAKLIAVDVAYRQGEIVGP